MTWCLVGLLSFLSQDPQQPQPGFEIVDLAPRRTQQTKKQPSVSARKAKPIEIKMAKKKRGESKLTKPKHTRPKRR